MRSILGLFLAVVALVLASPILAEDNKSFETQIQKYIAEKTPLTGGVACVSAPDARAFGWAALETRKDRMEALIRAGSCRLDERYVPQRLVVWLSDDILVLEVMGGENFIVKMWVVATPAALIPLIKTEEVHEVEPPGGIAPPSEVSPPQEVSPPRAPAAWE